MNTTTANTITSVTLDVPDVSAAERFYREFGLGSRLGFRESVAPSEGFRGFTLSLLVSQPADAAALLDAAVAAGATVIKPAAASLWGFGGTVQAPDGTIWKVATSKKKNTQPASRRIESIVLLLGASDVSASKRFYAEHGFTPGKSFGSYVEFDSDGAAIRLALYKRRALAKDAGVAPEGSGSHRVTVASAGGAFTDPDGFVWQ